MVEKLVQMGLVQILILMDLQLEIASLVADQPSAATRLTLSIGTGNYQAPSKNSVNYLPLLALG